MSGTTQNTDDGKMGNSKTSDEREFECVSGHYFDADTGSFVPLSNRRPMNQAERLLEDVTGVVSVAQVGRYFHVYVKDYRVDEREVDAQMCETGTARRTGRETLTSTPRKPYDKEIVYTIK